MPWLRFPDTRACVTLLLSLLLLSFHSSILRLWLPNHRGLWGLLACLAYQVSYIAKPPGLRRVSSYCHRWVSQQGLRGC